MTPTNTVTYTCGDEEWGDLLTEYDDIDITYDDIGNPLEYYDGRQFTMDWTEGRRLAKLTCNGKVTQYRYNADGIRTKKTRADGTWVEYILAEGRAVGEITYSAAGSAVGYLKYFFDEAGAPTGFSLWDNSGNTWVHYYLVKNLQGDVVAVYSHDTSESVATYTYDAWGNILTSEGTMAEINPFRYRGYYYDAESEFYYLQSRYYNPNLGRFINADAYLSTGQGILGNNMFAYCGNTPINAIDTTGCAKVLLKNDCYPYASGGSLGLLGSFSVVEAILILLNKSDCADVAVATDELEDYERDRTAALEKAEVRKYNWDYEKHHIVAHGSYKAEEAREVMVRLYPDGVEDKINIVNLKTAVHKRVHTNLYYAVTNSLVVKAYDIANGDPARARTNVGIALTAIRTVLLGFNELKEW